MTTLEALAARFDRLESELALHRLVHRYCVGADRRNLDTWSSVWTPDAQWQVGPQQVFTGIDAIREAIQLQWSAYSAAQHSTVNHSVEIDGDQATGRADVVVMTQLGGQFTENVGDWIVGGGTYIDEYRRVDGDWRIARRRVDRYFDLAPLAPGSSATLDQVEA